MRLGIPILLGYLPVGAAFGIVAHTAGFSVLQASACSALALAGAGQFVGLSLFASGADLASIIIATSVVNLRYVLFGATVAASVRGTPAHEQAALAYTLTDETFAINMSDVRTGRATTASMTGVGLVALVGWVVGTAVGAGAADLIGDPSAWGVHYAMPAMFTALVVDQATDMRHVLTGLVAAILAVAGMLVLPGSWYLLVASMSAATFAAVVWR